MLNIRLQNYFNSKIFPIYGRTQRDNNSSSIMLSYRKCNTQDIKMAWNLCTHIWRMHAMWDAIYSGSLQHSWAPVPMNLNFWLQEELEISLCLFSAINFSPLISLQLRKIKEFASCTVTSISHQCSVTICNWPLTTSSNQLIPDWGCSCTSALQKCNQSVTWLSSHTCYEIVKLHTSQSALHPKLP